MNKLNPVALVLWIFGASAGYACGNLALGLAITTGITLLAVMVENGKKKTKEQPVHKQIVIVKGDTNDADYITEETELKGWALEQLPLLKKIAKAITARDKEMEDTSQYNWGNSEYSNANPEKIYKGILTEEDIGIFNGTFCPWGEQGIHTVESIRIITITKDTELIGK